MKTIRFSFITKTLVAFAVILMAHCSSSAKQKQTATISTNPPLVLSYYSIGSGTPDDQLMKDFVTNYRQKNKLKPITATLYGGRGREGEHSYVFSLKELNAKQQQKFIADLKKALPTLKSKQENGGINIVENQPFDPNGGRMEPQTIEF